MQSVTVAQEILAQESGSAGSITGFLVIIAILGAFFYFLIIRPQRRQMQRRQELAGSLDIDDEVRTGGGIFGVVRRIDTDTVVLETEDGSLIKVLKLAIVAKTGDGS